MNRVGHIIFVSIAMLVLVASFTFKNDEYQEIIDVANTASGSALVGYVLGRIRSNWDNIVRVLRSIFQK